MSLKLFTAVAALAATASLFGATPSETIETNDGCVYMGRTYEQDFKRGETTFFTDSAIIVVSKSDLSAPNKTRKNIDDLDEKWQAWFAARPYLVLENEYGDEYVYLYNIKTGKRNVSETVFILENGPDFYRYFTFTEGRDQISDKDIKNITYAPANIKDKSGVSNEIITTDGKKYEGQIVSENSRHTGIMNREGIVYLVPNKLIAAKKTLLPKPELKNVGLLPYMDIIQTDVFTEGYILERNLRPSDGSAPYYLVFRPAEDSTVKIYLKDVKKLTKKKNNQVPTVVDEQDEDEDEDEVEAEEDEDDEDVEFDDEEEEDDDDDEDAIRL